MGLEIGGLLQLFVGAFTTVSQVSASNRARSARREAQAVQGASQEIQNRRERRRIAKQERIRRAQIIQSARSSNVSGSSGSLGAQSAIGSSFGSSVAGQQTGVLAAQGISRANQSAADAVSRGKQVGAFAGLASEVIDFGSTEGWFD